ncbi:transglycosylase SLT domain-containing protein [Treponema sp. R6D11]
MFDLIMALILTIAAETGVPPRFALAVALEENRTLNPAAVSRVNDNGSYDLGVMQLNSEFYGRINWRDPETNIRAGCLHIKELMSKPELNTYWSVAVAYNCGFARYSNGKTPPRNSLEYADRVMARWYKLEGVIYINPVIRGKREN